MDIFEQYNDAIESIRDKAADHAKILILEQLEQLNLLLPDHRFSFESSQYDCQISVIPPLKGGHTEFQSYDVIQIAKLYDETFPRDEIYHIVVKIENIDSYISDTYKRTIDDVKTPLRVNSDV